MVLLNRNRRRHSRRWSRRLGQHRPLNEVQQVAVEQHRIFIVWTMPGVHGHHLRQPQVGAVFSAEASTPPTLTPSHATSKQCTARTCTLEQCCSSSWALAGALFSGSFSPCAPHADMHTIDMGSQGCTYLSGPPPLPPPPPRCPACLQHQGRPAVALSHEVVEGAGRRQVEHAAEDAEGARVAGRPPDAPAQPLVGAVRGARVDASQLALHPSLEEGEERLHMCVSVSGSERSVGDCLSAADDPEALEGRINNPSHSLDSTALTELTTLTTKGGGGVAGAGGCAGGL